MSRTTIDIDDEACAAVMQRYDLKTKRAAVNLALRRLSGKPIPPSIPKNVDEIRKLRGSGWDGDLDEMRGGRP